MTTSADHLSRVRALTAGIIRSTIRRRTVSSGAGVRIHQSGRSGVTISRS